MKGDGILVLLPHNPGDVIMALQAVRRVVAAAPGIPVDYVVSSESLGLVQCSPLIRKVFVLPGRELRAAWEAGADAEVRGAIETFLDALNATRYALAANLYQERAGGLIQGCVDADAKIGLEFRDGAHFQVRGRWMEHLFAVPADRSRNPFHVVDIYARAMLAALAPLGASAASGTPGAPDARDAGSVPPRDRSSGRPSDILPPRSRPEAARDLEPGGYLAFHPGSAWPGKRWPEAHWSGLAARCARAGFRIVLTGAAEERGLADRIAASLPADCRAQVENLAGAATLPGTAWVLEHARLVVSGDTVAMHLAAATGTPVLALFGPSNPVETGPYGAGHVIFHAGPGPAADLALDREHPGLAGLGPEAVAGWILEGELPSGHSRWETAWETAWDEREGAQLLVDRRRSPHPYWVRGLELAHAIDRPLDGIRPGPAAAASRPGPRETLHRILAEGADGANGVDRPAGWAPDAGFLARLAAAERELEAETRNDVVWEAYRIAANGLPLRDFARHLSERKARFERARSEEAVLSDRRYAAREG